MVIIFNILAIIMFVTLFIMIRIAVGLYINKLFAEWSFKELNKRRGTSDLGYSIRVYKQFNPNEFIYRKLNCWDFKAVLTYCKQRETGA